jgi:hypothetical protein
MSSARDVTVIIRVTEYQRSSSKAAGLRLPVTIGSRFGEWRVCRLGGWTRHRLSYLVMLVRVIKRDPNGIVHHGRAFHRLGQRSF